MFIEFPKYLFHHKHEPRVVQNPDEEKALGGEWVASPALVKQPEPEVKPEPKTK